MRGNIDNPSCWKETFPVGIVGPDMQLFSQVSFIKPYPRLNCDNGSNGEDTSDTF